MTRLRRLSVIRFDPTMYSRWCQMHIKDRKQTLANIKSLTSFSAAASLETLGDLLVSLSED